MMTSADLSTPPDEFLCPISFSLMEDPVTLTDGHTYDRDNITKWLSEHGKSPLSNTPATIHDIKPNFALRTALERWKNEHASSLQPSPTMTPIHREFAARTDGEHVFVQISPTSPPAPLSHVTILVTDVSGSMQESSARPGGAAKAEGSLFSRLDLVKHACRTIARMHADRSGKLAIVSFSTAAKLALPLTRMDAPGLAAAERAIGALEADGGTNMWSGLLTALNLARSYRAKGDPHAHVEIIFLTDGEPTPDYLPVRGLVNTLSRKIQEIAGSHSWLTLHSFGFGTSLDSKLLEAISVAGNGIYGYLPDCSMVGSVAINAAAASLATVAPHVYVARPGGDRKFLGNLLADAPKHVLFAGVQVGDHLEISCEAQTVTVTVTQASPAESQKATLIARLCTEIAKASTSADWNAVDRQGLPDLAVGLGNSTEISDFVQAVAQDIDHADPHKGQLTKALKTSDWFSAWGLNHLISYSRALTCQQTTNFKDAALQFFASPSFTEIQSIGNDIFDNLPPPTPSLLPRKEVDASFHSPHVVPYPGAPMARTMFMAAAPAQAPAMAMADFSMAEFNDARGGCWTGNARVAMADGSEKFTHQLVAGDVVEGGHKVLCVVRTETTKPIKMVRLGNHFSITPWHPVFMDGVWAFPTNISTEYASTSNEFNVYLYDLVLESGHFVRIGRYRVCTLGHHFQEDVVKHEYFGTNAVIEHLKVLPGWTTGLVTVPLGYLRLELDFQLA